MKTRQVFQLLIVTICTALSLCLLSTCSGGDDDDDDGGADPECDRDCLLANEDAKKLCSDAFYSCVEQCPYDNGEYEMYCVWDCEDTLWACEDAADVEFESCYEICGACFQAMRACVDDCGSSSSEACAQACMKHLDSCIGWDRECLDACEAEEDACKDLCDGLENEKEYYSCEAECEDADYECPRECY